MSILGINPSFFGAFQNFFALELREGLLHVHMDLGEGPINVRASRLSLNDGQWHHVELNLKRSIGRIAINGANQSFEMPGKCVGHQINVLGWPYKLRHLFLYKREENLASTQS